MDLTLLLILAAFFSLGVALWLQIRPLGEDADTFARRRRRTGIALALTLLALGVVHAVATGTLRPRLFAPKEDGSWAAVTIDGRPIASDAYNIGIRDRQVAGGRDDCNDWGYDDDPPNAAGERMINSTLVGCPEDDPVRQAYWTLVIAPDAIVELRADGMLRLAARGHEAIFRRCTWTEEPFPAGTSGSGRRLCITR